jgi:hypothetical protein
MPGFRRGDVPTESVGTAPPQPFSPELDDGRQRVKTRRASTLAESTAEGRRRTLALLFLSSNDHGFRRLQR